MLTQLYTVELSNGLFFELITGTFPLPCMCTAWVLFRLNTVVMLTSMCYRIRLVA